MSGKHYLGVDIGSHEAKGVAVDANGRTLATATARYRPRAVKPGFAELRPREDVWNAFGEVCRRLLSDARIAPDSVRGLSTSAVSPSLIALDPAGEPLTDVILAALDGRAVAEAAELNKGIGEERLLDRCGATLAAQSVGSLILWLKRNRADVFRKTASLLSANAWLVRQLTGAARIDHHGAAAFAPLYDAEAGAWSAALAPDLAPLEWLPGLAWTSEIAGALTAEAAAATGLAAGTPVAVGTADSAAAALSVGVVELGDVMLMYGDALAVVMLTATPGRDARLWYAPWLFEGQHAVTAGLAAGGTLGDWFAAALAPDLDAAAATARLAGEAEASPRGANGLIVLPHFAGERTPVHDPHAKGMAFGLHLGHTRGDLFRATFEGLAYGTNHIVETLREAGQIPKRILSLGPGLKSRVWAQATSDVTGRTQALSSSMAGAAYGDAFLAALAMGDVKAEHIRIWNPVSSEIVPRQSDVYRRQYAVYKELYGRTRDLMRRLDG